MSPLTFIVRTMAFCNIVLRSGFSQPFVWLAFFCFSGHGDDLRTETPHLIFLFSFTYLRMHLPVHIVPPTVKVTINSIAVCSAAV